MNTSLKGKVALITGGGSGIGEACARLFSDCGCSVAIMGRRHEPLNQLASEIGALPIAADTSSEDDCIEAVNSVCRKFDGLDILVCSAGIFKEGSVTEISQDDWQKMIDINLSGIMKISRACIPEMMARSGGAIVNVSSLGGIVAPGNMSAYIASKTAVIGLTRSMAVDYGPHGVRVNSLCPGWVQTPMSEHEMEHYAEEKGISTEEAIRCATRYLPLGRMAQPIEIAKCVRFLASEESSFVTGATLIADGGSHVVDVGYISLI